jgi:membrane protein required for colicin V production
MSFTLLDFILFGIMGVSGLLAVMRGFTREILSLVAWGLALLAGYFASQQQQLVDLVLPYIDKPTAAQIAIAVAAFLITLIVISIISVRISDMVVDSSAGAIDRTLGFVYGLLRGLVLVGLAYLFYGYLQPPQRQEEWVKGAYTYGIVQKTADMIRGFMPPDIAETLANATMGNQTPDAALPDGSAPADAPVDPAAPAQPAGDTAAPAQPAQPQQ